MDLRSKAKTLPRTPGVYLFKDAAGEVLYVGKSGSLRDRVSSYFSTDLDLRKAEMVSRSVDIEVVLAPTEKEALILESNFIKRFQPPFNIRLADDTRYPFIRLSADDFPRIDMVREVAAKGSFYGPYPSAGAARETLKVAREVFGIRDCREFVKGGCLNHQIGTCLGPCIDAVDRAQYMDAVDAAKRFLAGHDDEVKARLKAEMQAASDKQEFERAARLRDRLASMHKTMERQAMLVAKADDADGVALAAQGGLGVAVIVMSRAGRVASQAEFHLRSTGTNEEALGEFMTRYYGEMPNLPKAIYAPPGVEGLEAISELLSEKRASRVVVSSPVRGRGMRLVKLARLNAEFKLGQYVARRGEAGFDEESQELGALLGLADAPTRIECFDISHLGGTGVVASMVAFEKGRPDKKNYRRFKLSREANDDYAAMREVVYRRYRRLRESASELPHLIIVDGGRGQLAKAIEAVHEAGVFDVPLIALAKGEESVFKEDVSLPLDTTRSPHALLLLRRIRDEAHRFAITYQRVKRRSISGESLLAGIPGLGPARRRALLMHYASLDEIRESSVEELSNVPGISPAIARRVLEELSRPR
ncbi:MAG: excinuclease ABC subunit UvrC [Euryarchaeota archaeon]|nr:excinuclease ABC subunit UvrC [Euryarchaeota archaeon]